MPQFTKLTPNLLVASVHAASRTRRHTRFRARHDRAEESPFAFGSVIAGPVEIFFNDAAGAVKEYPGFAGKPIGCSGTLFVEMQGVDALHDRIKGAVTVVMPLETKFYGMREFAIEDPDGYVITFAERTS
jgi:uncharacterized glyoxalase superfamily protein PhnB